jgi:hypothetical protein
MDALKVPDTTTGLPDQPEPGFNPVFCLGGHLKTGHTWPLQNRPTELDQDKSIYNPPMAVSANIFSQSGLRRAYTGQTWAEDLATRGRDQSADPGPEWRAAQTTPLSSHSGGKR